MRNTEPSSFSFNRRQFLRSVSAGTALFYIAPGAALKGAPRLSANEKINVTGIGVGSQGGSDSPTLRMGLGRCDRPGAHRPCLLRCFQKRILPDPQPR